MSTTSAGPMTLSEREYRMLVVRLNVVANLMADEVYTIRKRMEGRGISPAEAPMVNARMTEIEIKLRNLGANMNNPVPFNIGK